MPRNSDEWDRQAHDALKAWKRRENMRGGFTGGLPLKSVDRPLTDAELDRRAEASRQIGEIIDRQRTADA